MRDGTDRQTDGQTDKQTDKPVGDLVRAPPLSKFKGLPLEIKA